MWEVEHCLLSHLGVFSLELQIRQTCHSWRTRENPCYAGGVGRAGTWVWEQSIREKGRPLPCCMATARVKVSAHWVWNFRTLKNKYDLTLCQSRLHTASETFVRQRKFGSGSIFCIFASVACILIGKDGEYEKNGKTHAKIPDSVCNGL